MAAGFGVWEVKFPSSRAVYDDDDDEDDDSSILEEYSKSIFFHWAPDIVESSHTPSPREYPLLVIAIGKVATTFLEAHVSAEETKVLACLSSKKDNETNFESVCFTTKATGDSPFFRVTSTASDHKDPVVICHCRRPVSPEKAFYWTEKVGKRTRCGRDNKPHSIH